MRVAFRTDASARIGTGHVMRCLTLADALRAEGAECVFICREHVRNLLHAIRERGHQVLSLPAPAEDPSLPGPPSHASWLGADWATDAQQCRRALGERRVDWMVVDHYAIDYRWEAAMRPVCGKLMVIDDLADREHDCELLLDQNRVAGMAIRYAGKVPSTALTLLGPAYALLQREYADLRSKADVRSGRPRRVVVYFGGGDTRGMPAKTLLALHSLGTADLNIDVVAGSEAEATELKRLAQGEAAVRILLGLSSLAKAYLDADLAVGACGTTTWERCCLGLPALAVTVADNQLPIAQEMHRRRCLRWLGEADDVGVEALAAAIGDVVHAQLDPSWSARCSAEVDGRGTDRVVAAMLLDRSSPLTARRGGWGDEQILLQWANDPAVRLNAFHQAHIEPDEHESWLRRRLQRPDTCRIYVVESAGGLPVGQVRFELDNERWVIGYSVDALLRGRGMGTSVLAAATAALARAVGKPLRLVGRVKVSNVASCRTFERLGYRCKSVVDSVAEYELAIRASS